MPSLGSAPAAGDLSPNTGADPRPRLLALEALRGVAAVVVVVLHMAGPFGLPTFSRAYLAVDLFFLLSGFVMPYAYEGRMQAGLSAFGFMRLRFARLYPLYIAGMLVGIAALAVTAVVGGALPGEYQDVAVVALFGLFMLPTPLARWFGALYPANSPAWSLAFELVVNALYAVLRPWLSWRLLGLIIGGCLAFHAVEILNGRGINAGSNLDRVLAGLVRAALSYFMGVLLYKLWRKGSDRGVSRPLMSVAGALTPVLFLLVLAAGDIIEGKLFDLVTVALLLPLVVWTAVICPPGPVFELGFVLLGRLSYPLYAIHVPIILWLSPAFLRLGWSGETFPDVAAWAVLSALLLTALAVERVYDRPAQRLLKGRLARC